MNADNTFSNFPHSTGPRAQPVVARPEGNAPLDREQEGTTPSRKHAGPEAADRSERESGEPRPVGKRLPENLSNRRRAPSPIDEPRTPKSSLHRTDSGDEHTP
ncbi:MAG: hypothetical protein QOF48_2580 [Verrucomicrobiota bacterium]|jgi:hypothetical protein